MANRSTSFWGALGGSLNAISEDIDMRDKRKKEEAYRGEVLGLHRNADQRSAAAETRAQSLYDRQVKQEEEDKANMLIARDTLPFAAQASATGDLSPLIERLNTHSAKTGATFSAVPNEDGTWAINIKRGDQDQTFSMDTKGALNALAGQIPYSKALNEKIVEWQAQVPLKDQEREKDHSNKMEVVNTQEAGANTRSAASNTTSEKIAQGNNTTSLKVAEGNNATSVKVANIGASATLGGAKLRAAQGVDENGNPIKGQDTASSHREAIGKALDRYAQRQWLAEDGTMAGPPQVNAQTRQEFADIQARLPTPPRGSDPEKVAARIRKIHALAMEKGDSLVLGAPATDKDPERARKARYEKGLELVLRDLKLAETGVVGGGTRAAH